MKAVSQATGVPEGVPALSSRAELALAWLADPGTVRRVARPPRPQATLRSGRGQQRIGKDPQARPASGPDVTSYFFFFPLLEKAQSIQRKRDDFRGFLLVSLALGSPGSQSTKGPLGSGSPEKGPGSLPDCSTYQCSFL